MKRIAMLVLALAQVHAVGEAAAAASEEEASRLGADLTPVGAERAGNTEGTIPPWTGGIRKPPAGWKVGAPRQDPYADDPKRLVIDASNVGEHAARLSPGQQALLRGLEGYRMDVFPTRRSCGYPDWVYEATRKNATGARLDDSGVYLAEGWHSFLFPIPHQGVEAIWNHQYSYFAEARSSTSRRWRPRRAAA